MDINIKLTDEEREEFNALSEEQQKEFIDGVALRRKYLLLKTAVASMFLVECFDELESLGLLRHMLKKTGKRYNNLIVKYLGDIFDRQENMKDGSISTATEFLNSQIKAMHDIFDKKEEKK